MAELDRSIGSHQFDSTVTNMKNIINNSKVSCDIKSKSKIKDLLNRQLNKIKHSSFTCPLCKEAFTGLAALGAHLKDHCT